MHSVFSQVSGLAALLILFRELWAQAPLEHTLFTTLGTGIGVYLVLVGVQASLRHILRHTPSASGAGKTAAPARTEATPASEGVGEQAALAS